MSEQKKKVGYSYAGKESIEEIIYKSFPRQLRPTKRTNSYFGTIFLIVLIMAFINFPYNAFMTGDTEVTINVGYPWVFLKFDLSDIEANPLQIGGLIIDLLLYFFIAYIADIFTSLILTNPLLVSKKDSKKRPKIFEDRQSTIAEKLTEKLPPSPTKINNQLVPPKPKDNLS